TSGELDIMEYLGHEQNRTHGTVHYGPGPGSTHVSKNTTTAGANLAQEFHVYSLEWQEDEIKWLPDGVVFATFKKSDVQAGMIYPFNEDFFFIINLAVGGNWPG